MLEEDVAGLLVVSTENSQGLVNAYSFFFIYESPLICYLLLCHIVTIKYCLFEKGKFLSFLKIVIYTNDMISRFQYLAN